jgi:hypothetical protein
MSTVTLRRSSRTKFAPTWRLSPGIDRSDLRSSSRRSCLISPPICFHVAFVLGDRPGKVSADYLTDMVDYAPGSLWGLPTLGEERLVILLDWIEGVMLSPLVESLLVAVCECSDVGSWAKVHVHSFRQLMLDDFRREAPPNRLYWIFR